MRDRPPPGARVVPPIEGRGHALAAYYALCAQLGREPSPITEWAILGGDRPGAE